ncbi:SNO glutamine amidotransferase [Pterulicium gracile]|uniref:glutaminase n=1 Tax=Pterulicium gracile TaxID=1884261 RepID=A0A5C3QPE1_9AGAR|nr:SNO glutamine amidotransferase [Pterula gracilis]
MMPAAAPLNSVTVGVLAMQGAFAEHQKVLSKLSCKIKVIPILVRTNEDLQKCHALIIPGGESTTIALLARLAGILDPLKEFAKTHPIWGTCAGAILLSSQAVGLKKGGQDLFGGVGICVARNGWGTQVESFEAELEVKGLREGERGFHGVFIRAPVVLSFLPQQPDDPPIQVVARLSADVVPPLAGLDIDPSIKTDQTDVVALRQGMHLVTTFHPELTKDNRFHEYFVRECVLPSVQASTR